MKSLLAVAAFGCSLAFAQQPSPYYSNGNDTSSSLGSPISSTSGANSSSTAVNETSVAAVATSKVNGNDYGCSTAMATTTVFVTASDIASSTLASPVATLAHGTPMTVNNTYFYSLVNGSTAWSNGVVPPTDAATTWYSTTTVVFSPSAISSTDVKPAAINTRTLSFLTSSSSSTSTETIEVTDTMTLTATVHSNSLIPSSISGLSSVLISAVTDSPVISGLPSESTSSSKYSRAPYWPPTISSSNSASAVATTTSSNVTSSTLDSGVVASGSTSSGSDTTVFVTSSHTITERPTPSTTSWNATWGWNSTRGFGTDETIPAILTPTVSSPIAGSWSTSVSALESSSAIWFTTSPTFSNTSSVTTNQPRPIDTSSSISTVSSQSSIAIVPFSYGQVSMANSTLAGASSKQSASGATSSTFAQFSITSTAAQVNSSAYSPWPLTNSTAANAIATASTQVNFSSATSESVSATSYLWSSPVSAVSSSIIGGTSTSAGNNTSISSTFSTAYTTPVWGWYGVITPSSSTEANAVNTQASTINASSPITSTTASSPSTVTKTASYGGYGQVTGNSSTEAGAIATSSAFRTTTSSDQFALASTRVTTSSDQFTSSSSRVTMSSDQFTWSSTRITTSSDQSASSPTRITTSSGQFGWPSAGTTTSSDESVPPSTRITTSSDQYASSSGRLTTSSNQYDSFVSSPVTTSLVAPLGYHQAPPYPTSSAAVGTASNGTCGETGNFTMNWDDEPAYVQTSVTDPPYAPVFNPYHHLFFATGFAYYNPSDALTQVEPYDPVSGPNVAIFNVNYNESLADWNNVDETGMLPGTIGAGPRTNDETYWFNAYSVDLGCDNGGLHPCNMTITGYKWDEGLGQEQESIYHETQIPACNVFDDCELQPVDLAGFEGLSSIRFEAVVDNDQLKPFVLDNFSMGWYDNSCGAGIMRISSKK